MMVYDRDKIDFYFSNKNHGFDKPHILILGTFMSDLPKDIGIMRYWPQIKHRIGVRVICLPAQKPSAKAKLRVFRKTLCNAF